MQNNSTITLLGAPASPYTQKMLALLRYRHIPHTIIWGDAGAKLDEMNIARPKPLLLPVVLMAGDEGCNGEKKVAICDSTPIIRRLEAMYAERSVLPSNPVLAFIDYLLEDFADEWATKYMFHYRWQAPADASNAGIQLPLGMNVSLPDKDLQQVSAMITERQVKRLYVVGSNESTAPIIEASYQRLLLALETHFEQQPFLLGARPGASDFAFYGQLSQLVGFDPTPRSITYQRSPRTVAWVSVVQDQSGLEPLPNDWNTTEDPPATLRAVLAELGRVYVPAMLANAEAVMAKEKGWQVEIDGTLWQQQTFPYQAKCLAWIRAAYAELTAPQQAQVNELLEGTGCEPILNAG